MGGQQSAALRQVDTKTRGRADTRVVAATEPVQPFPGSDQHALPGCRNGTCAREDSAAQACALKLLQQGIFSNISHELLTPLTAIRGYLSLLTQGILGPLAPEQEAALHVALSNTDHLHGMIGDLLDYASLARDTLTLAHEPVDLNEALTSVIQRASLHDTASQVVITARLPVKLGVVLGDRRRLTRAFEHLLENAIKFSAPGQCVCVTARRSGATALITVRDQGIGMTAELRNNACQPFVQGESGLARQYYGLGLGLTLVQKLIMLHDGQLRIRSARNHGTTATVMLPIQG